MMKRILIMVIAMVVLALSAAHAEEPDDMVGGYKLGKFNMATSLLAMELIMLEQLDADKGFLQYTQENIDAGKFEQEDSDAAIIMHTYALIRANTFIIEVCKSGLEDDFSTHPVMEPFRLRTQPLLEDLLADTEEFIAGDDPAALGVYVQKLKAGDYVNRLIELATEADATAGETEATVNQP